MVETIIHSLGFCGEPHVKLLDLVYLHSYIIENKNTLAYTFKIPGIYKFK